MKIQRRHWLMGGVAAAAAAGGAWWADRRFSPRPLADPAAASFWTSSFESPEGRPIAMADFRGRPLLVNFWATWCPPCVEELPLLNAFYRERSAQGWQLIGLAVDRVEPVRQFLQRLPLDFPVAMTGFPGAELSRTLGNPAGGLPFTVVFDRDGSVLHRKIGQVHREDLDQWVKLV